MALGGSAAKGLGAARDRENSAKPPALGGLSLAEADSVLGHLWDQDVLAWDRY